VLYNRHHHLSYPHSGGIPGSVLISVCLIGFAPRELCLLSMGSAIVAFLLID